MIKDSVPQGLVQSLDRMINYMKSTGNLNSLIIDEELREKEPFVEVVFDHALGNSSSIENYEYINSVLKAEFGDAVTFTPHGVFPSIRDRWEYDQRKLAVETLCEFFNFMSGIGLDSYATSGTLLGIIREGDFISHDDDIDLAYISKFSDPSDILIERLELANKISADLGLKVYESTGGHLKIETSGKGIAFIFDLFTAFVDQDGFLNQYPLRPRSLKVDEVVPIKKLNFYGSEVNVPASPEKHLELNYGSAWRIPDPCFRFDWKVGGGFYTFLTSNRLIEDGENKLKFSAKSQYEISNSFKIVTKTPLDSATKSFDLFKFEAISFARNQVDFKPVIWIFGSGSENLLKWLVENKEEFSKIYFFDDKQPMDKDFHFYKKGQILYVERWEEDYGKTIQFVVEDKRGDVIKKAISLGKKHTPDIVFFDTNTQLKTSQYMKSLVSGGKSSRKSNMKNDVESIIVIFDEYFLDGSTDEMKALQDFEILGSFNCKKLGRTPWAQAIFSFERC